MSTVININFCQKACVSIPSGNCLFLPITWLSQTPNIVNVYGNGENAIIKAVYGAIGTGTVTISDSSGIIFVIYVNVSAYSDPVVNPKYQYVYSVSFSGSVPGGFPATRSIANISGPYTSLIVPFQSNVVSIFMPQITSNGIIYPNSCVFIPGTTSSVRALGNFPSALTFFLGLALFKPTINVLIDSKLIFADIINSGNPISTYNILTFNMAEFLYITNYVPYCDTVNYIVFAIPNILTSSTTGAYVTGSKLLPGGTIGIQTQNLNIATTFNVIVVPSNIYNTSSNDLVYSKIITPTIINGINTITIDPITLGTVVWFVQQYGYDNTGLLQINGVEQTNSTTLTIRISASGIVTGRKLSLLAYKAQSSVGFSAIFP